ncbi:thrombospondin type 3 repeat-containing protein [Polyangium sp. 6x1]|uniref:thrombospondin type 3 repeat-containing protein n=1 Tax=Polyangium sp. 6x1 TaxID=3042689 RepID=UPI002482656F|nr:thrombospondin type 3 repeat-containing protein [Polyangium sp. 6x1]MDI1443087.1 thrombospondin type 3 repeat-containing protein [Polyangium sp. 6x1]
MNRRNRFSYATGLFTALILAGCMDFGAPGESVETSRDNLAAPPVTCPDGDADGICDSSDNCPGVGNPEQRDGDGNGLGDACDCPDPDADLICSFDDNCPTWKNPDQVDTDGDGIGDVCDAACPDIDGDRICNDVDNCPEWGNPKQEDSDGDGIGDACECPDADKDTVCDPDDNCPHHVNPDQADLDQDGLGDACDACADVDGDLVCDVPPPPEPPPPPPPEPPPPPPPEPPPPPPPPPPPACADLDLDLVCDPVDNCPIPNPDQVDLDEDGLGDACDDCIDVDRDFICEPFDVCPGTLIPEATVPAITLWYSRYALVDGDPVFDTGGVKGQPVQRIYTLEDTRGCSCEQIAAALGLGQGVLDHGCSISTMNFWISQVNP